jgi:hypothetical protein
MNEHDNRRAIGEIEAREVPEFVLKDARWGMLPGAEGYQVVAINEQFQQVRVATFGMVGTEGRERARFLAKMLTRRINAGEFQ